jgi:hypothetical protein
VKCLALEQGSIQLRNMTEEIQNYVQYGYGDFAPNDEEQMTGVRVDPQDALNNDIVQGTGSRDIRNINDTLTSLTYLVKFDAGAVNNYPVTVEWNIMIFQMVQHYF